MKNEATNAAIVLKSIEADAAPLFKQLKKLTVTDGTSYNLVSDKIDALKQLGKQAEEKEGTFTVPLTKLIKDVKSLFAPFRAMVAEAEKTAKLELAAYQDKMELEREKIKSDLEAGKIAKVSTAAKKIAATEISASTSSVKKVWTLEIEDVGDIPREFLIPDESKIREAFKSGRKVSGCKWYQKTTIAI